MQTTQGHSLASNKPQGNKTIALPGTYLNFEGNAEEALNFYVDVFNSEIMDITRYDDFGDAFLSASKYTI